jgi:hypothetical protein
MKPMMISRRHAFTLPFAAAAASAAGENDLRFHSGNHEVDLGVRPTIDFLVQLFDIRDPWLPDFAFIDDGAIVNAFASTPQIGVTGPLTRPAIRVGRKLVQTIITKADGNYGAALTGVFAHEFAHIYQMKTNYKSTLESADSASSTRLLECHADFLAGWALPQAKWITEMADLGLAAKQFYELGDIDFEAQAHHGTGLQRQSIMASGFSWGLIRPDDVDAAAAQGLAVLKDLFPQWVRST